MKQRGPAKPEPKTERVSQLYALLFGGFLGLTIIKFGNVAIFESLVTWPENRWEWALNPWPVAIGYVLLAILAILGIAVARWEIRGPKWLLFLPLAWLIWQFLAATQSVDATLTRATRFVAWNISDPVFFVLSGREQLVAALNAHFPMPGADVLLKGSKKKAG